MVISLWLTSRPSEVVTSKSLLIEIHYDHRVKTIPSCVCVCLCVCISVIRLFPETNDVDDKIFRSKLEIILEKYFNVFVDVFEKSFTLWKYLTTYTFNYGKLKYKYLKKYLNTFKCKCIWSDVCLTNYHQTNKAYCVYN